MENREIIEAMHGGYSPHETPQPDDSAKELLAAEFPRFHAPFKQFTRERPDLAMTPEVKDRFHSIVEGATELRSLHQELINATRAVFNGSTME